MTLDENIRQQIMAHADGQLAGDKAAYIEKLAAENPEARAYLDELRRFDQMIGADVPDEPNEEQWNDVWRGIQDELAPVGKRRIIPLWWSAPLAVAAAVVLVFSLVYIFSDTLTPTKPMTKPIQIVDASGEYENVGGGDTIYLDFPEDSVKIIWTVTDDTSTVPIAF